MHSCSPPLEALLAAAMPTMTIPSANMRRLKRLAAEAAAKSPGGRPRSNLRMRPPPVPRHEERFAPLAPPDACEGQADRTAGVRPGARVLVRTPTSASVGTAPPAALSVELVPAVVVSAADENGYLEVLIEGASLPGEDPFASVRVPMDQIVASMPPPAAGGVARKATSSSPPGAEAHANLEMLAGAAINLN